MNTLNINVIKLENKKLASSINNLSEVLQYNNYTEYSKFVIEIFSNTKDEDEIIFLKKVFKIVIEKLSKLNF
jgi:hypothetical protein